METPNTCSGAELTRRAARTQKTVASLTLRNRKKQAEKIITKRGQLGDDSTSLATIDRLVGSTPV